MPSEDDIRPMIEQKLCNALLIGILLCFVFNPPMDHHGNQVRIQRLRLIERGKQAFFIQSRKTCQIVRVEQVNRKRRFLGKRYSVRSIGIANERNRYSADIGDDDIALRFLLGTACSHMSDADLIQHIQRSAQSRKAFIHAVIVGGQQQVESSIQQSVSEFVGRIEVRIAGVGWAAGKSRLQICHRIIRAADKRLGFFQNMPVIIRRRLRVPCVVGNRHMAHYIAADHKRRDGRLRLDRCNRLNWVDRSGRYLIIIRLLRTSGGFSLILGRVVLHFYRDGFLLRSGIAFRCAARQRKQHSQQERQQDL